MKIDESDFVDGKMTKETLFERNPDGTLKKKIIKEGIAILRRMENCLN